MEQEGDGVKLILHYYMENENLHEMNADIHNKCGASVIDVINHLKDVFDDDCELDFSTSEEGGVKDIYKIVFKNKGGHDLFIMLVSALIGHFIGVAPSIDESEKQLNRAETIEKIKSGKFTKEEEAFVLTGDPEYIEKRNLIYLF